MRGGAFIIVLVPLEEEIGESLSPFSLLFTMRRHSKKVSLCKLGSYDAGTLISNFPASSTMRNNGLKKKKSRLWRSIRAVWAN